jgi:hypothetical protein
MVVTLYGASGGTYLTGVGGSGDSVVSTVPVSAGQVYYLYVGSSPPTAQAASQVL